MKDFLIAIIILLILVSAFGTIESRIEFEYPFGNWAVPGNTGQPVPGDGEPGGANTFSFGSAESKSQVEYQEESQVSSDCPITVTVVTETEQKESVLAWVFTILAGVVILVCHVIAGCWYVQYFKERRRNKL